MAEAAYTPREQLLVVEPRSHLADALAGVLPVRAVRTAPAARELLRHARPWLGLVSAEDVGRTSGLELAEFARAAHPAMPALLVAVAPEAHTLERAWQRGVSVLAGPLSAADARELARRVRAAGQSLHPALLAQIDTAATTYALTPWEVEMLVATIRGRDRAAILRETGLLRDTLKSRLRVMLRKCGSADLASFALSVCRAAGTRVEPLATDTRARPRGGARPRRG